MKEKNEKKETKVVRKTKVVKKTKRSEEDKILFSDNIKKLVKLASVLCAFFSTILILIMLFFGIVTTFIVINSDKGQLVGNNTIITFVSNINDYSIQEMINTIETMDSKGIFIIMEIILPVIALIAVGLLLIILSKKILDFIANVKYEKDLFALDKVDEVRVIANNLSLVLLVTFVIFDNPSFLVYALIEFLIYASYKLYMRCINNCYKIKEEKE